MTGYIISTGAHYHWVRKITASTHGDGVLRLTLHGDRDANDLQFNEAEITIFTDDVDLTERLIKAISSVNAEREAAKQSEAA